MSTAALPFSGVLLSVLSAVMWGWYPVLGRYLQTREIGQPSTAACLAALTTLDTVLLLCFMGAQSLCSEKSLPHSASFRRRRARYAAGYGSLCVVRMWTNLESTRLTNVFNVQMTALMLPFVTAGMAKVLLKEDIHWALPPTLLASVVASVLAICGQGLSPASQRLSGALGWWDAVGIALQLFSVVCSAAVKIALKGTEDVLGKGELMLAQMVTTCVVMLPACLIFDRSSLVALTQLDTAGVAAFLGLAIGVYLVANATQIMATRQLGASNHSASNSLRLVSACVGSWLVLDEPITNVLQWAGLVMIIFALITYWRLRNPGVVHTTGTPGHHCSGPCLGGRRRHASTACYRRRDRECTRVTRCTVHGR